MRIVKVLFLDDAPWFLPTLDLARQGVQLEVTQEAAWGSRDVYSAPATLLENIAELTSRREVDIVVIGNNRGAGVPKAEAVADEMKDMTVVVWNDYYEGTEAPYASLGLKHFGSRPDLKRIVPAMLGLGTGGS